VTFEHLGKFLALFEPREATGFGVDLLGRDDVLDQLFHLAAKVPAALTADRTAIICLSDGSWTVDSAWAALSCCSI
jgi:hypothetical protein